jgi:hypothetical protein
MSARDELIEIVTSSPESSGGDAVWATSLVDAHRAEVIAEADLLPKADVVAWLVKKAREETPVWLLASKVERGAVRPDNLRMLPEPVFFEADRTYAREYHGRRIEFLVRLIDVTPDGAKYTAFGWRRFDGQEWEPSDSDDFTGWIDITDAGAVTA